jgi:hypothetical protein
MSEIVSNRIRKIRMGEIVSNRIRKIRMGEIGRKELVRIEFEYSAGDSSTRTHKLTNPGHALLHKMR